MTCTAVFGTCSPLPSLVACVAQVRLQTQAELPAGAVAGADYFHSPLDCVRKTLANEGARGFYRGMLSPIVGNAPINAIVFAVEGQAMRWMSALGSRHADDALGHAFAGGLSGLLQCSISTPTELVKIKLQVERGSSNPLYRGPAECARYLWRAGGVRELYRGLLWTVARDTPAFASYFFTYHYLKGWFSDRQLEELRRQHRSGTGHAGHGVVSDPGLRMVPRSVGGVGVPEPTQEDVNIGAAEYLMSGGVAGFVSWACLHPVDVMKSLKQMQPAGDRSSVLTVARRLWAEESWRFLFRGYLPTILRSFPVSAVTFAVYEWSLVGLDKVGLVSPSQTSDDW